MSYSISVSSRTLKLRDEMYEFLQRTYRPWFEILAEDEDTDSFSGPYIEGDLASGGANSIGFEYVPGDMAEREYHFALMRWVSLQIGKRRSRFRAEGVLARAVPFVQFGSETQPVFSLNEWASGNKSPGPLVDHLGMRVDDCVARELAWLCLPESAYEKVSSTHWGRSAAEVEEALIAEGIESAYDVLSIIHSQLARMDTLWRGR